MSATRPDWDHDSNVETVTQKRTELKRPQRYRVLLHNDDYTSMEFVTAVLMHVFHHNAANASAIMLSVHRTGIGVAGIYTHEIATEKVSRTMRLAEEAGHPLQCTMEPVEL